MSAFTRTDTSVLGRWWWTVDRWALAALLLLVAMGAVLTMAASPAVAERLDLDAFHFARRQFVYQPLAVALILATSLLSPRGVRRVAILVFGGALVLTASTLVVGDEIKGATRWLHVAGFSLQPSEILKPAFVVVCAWLFAAGRIDGRVPGGAVAAGLLAVVCAVLLLQPDVGMTLLVAGTWGVQCFLAGLPMILVILLGFAILAGSVGAYFTFDHVRARVDHFLDPASGEGFQVARALEAFRNGGLFGRGPGEGRVKEVLPDAHADFILAVAGEEFGLIACLLLVGLFAFVVLRGFSRVLRADDMFVVLTVGGLAALFGFQALINMASTTQLMPPKGMTLPFISYGGSATLALAWGMGMLLALTRDRRGPGGER